MRPVAWLLTAKDGGRFLSYDEPKGGIFFPLYGPEQLAEAVAERDLLIRDLRKELNERRYGRSTSKLTQTEQSAQTRDADGREVVWQVLTTEGWRTVANHERFQRLGYEMRKICGHEAFTREGGV